MLSQAHVFCVCMWKRKIGVMKKRKSAGVSVYVSMYICGWFAGCTYAQVSSNYENFMYLPLLCIASTYAHVCVCLRICFSFLHCTAGTWGKVAVIKIFVCTRLLPCVVKFCNKLQVPYRRCSAALWFSVYFYFCWVHEHFLICFLSTLLFGSFLHFLSSSEIILT